jgi:hypothetical protein
LTSIPINNKEHLFQLHILFYRIRLHTSQKIFFTNIDLFSMSLLNSQSLDLGMAVCRF